MLDISLDGRAVVRVDDLAGQNQGFELWLDGAYHGNAEMVDAGPCSASRINRLTAKLGSERLSTWLTADAELNPCSINFAPDWSLSGAETAHLYGTDDASVTAVYHCPIQGEHLAAIAGETYAFSLRGALHRCNGWISLSFFDKSGKALDTFEAEISTDAEGGRHLSNYAKVVLVARAPKRAVSMSAKVHKGPTVVGEDSFLFFTKPCLTRGEEAQTNHDSSAVFAPETTLEIFSVPPEKIQLQYITSPLPEEVEGATGTIEVVDIQTGLRFPIPATTRPVTRVHVHGLEGAVLVGHIMAIAEETEALNLALWVDGRLSEVSSIAMPHMWDSLRVPLPQSACDGLPHLFQVKDADDGSLYSQFEDFGPASLTPWYALQIHAGPPLPFERAPAASNRYKALRNGIQALLSAAEGKSAQELAANLQTLATAHELVVGGFERVRSDFPCLAFPKVAAPKVTVVIPVHNKFEVTYNCLAGLLLGTNKASFDVVIVDDGSKDRTHKLGEFAENITTVRNEVALGFVGACNRGAAEAKGEFIVFLNNDTEVTSGWLDELLFVFDTFDGVGLAGSKLLYADGRLQEAGGIVWETGDPWNYGRGGNASDPKYCYTREVDYLSGASVMISRSLWHELGGFSSEFAPAYFEDTDLAFKVKAAGKKVVFAPFSVVYHFEGLSNGTDSNASEGLKRFQEINRPKFKRKWRALFKNNGKVGVDVDLAKDRNVARRAAMFDLDTPRLDNDAGSYAAIQEIRLLQSLGFKVTFVPTNLAYLGRHTELMQRIGVEVIYSPFYRSAEDFIAARGGEFDLFFLTRHQVARQLSDVIRAAAPNVPIVCNIADLHFLRALREASLSTPHENQLAEIAHQRDLELEALSKTDLILTYSTIEQSVITSHRLGQSKVALLPWVVEPVKPVRGFAEREGLAFLGGFRHPPNVDAVQYFVREVMPGLRERLPGVPFRIYGSSIPAELQTLAADDVIFEGHVADIATVFDHCRVFVTPLQYGAGVKGKVLDCLAAGVPAVLSPVAGEGLPIRNGVDAMIAQRPAEWVDAIASLYVDEKRWSEMSSAMLGLAKRAYSFQGGQKIMQSALDAVELYTVGDASALFATISRPALVGLI
jgi:GT2 family glycosyltransferase